MRSRPRQRAGGPSMMMLIQSSSSAEKGGGMSSSTATSTTSTAETLTVSWKRMKRLKLSVMPRPQRMARTMVAKASSSNRMSQASLVTSVPVMPMATPTSASLMAGASLMPSPVTATDSPCALSVRTTRSLTEGVERAMTRTLLSASAKAVSSSFSSSAAVTARWPPSSMPSERAMAVAVIRLSPVSIITEMPAVRQASMAGGTSSRTGSAMAAKPS